MNKDTIFISVASYRDKDCPITISDAFKKAKYPERIYIGVCQQNDEKDVDCLDTSTIDNRYRSNVRIMRILHTDAKGPTWARYLCSTLYKGETYYMQIDSHTIFAQDWDQKAIDMMNYIINTNMSKKPVISHYPNQFDPEDPDKVDDSVVTRICKFGFNNDELINVKESVLYSAAKRPTPAYLITGGFFFVEGSFLNEVPFDPDLPDLFEGEEILFTTRAWTNGWDIYSPNVNFCFHYYGREKSPKFWSDKKTDAIESEKKVKKIIYDGDKSYGIYGLGNKRDIKDFFKLVGMNKKEKKFEKDMCLDEDGKLLEWFKPGMEKRNKNNHKIYLMFISFLLFSIFLVCKKYRFYVGFIVIVLTFISFMVVVKEKTQDDLPKSENIIVCTFYTDNIADYSDKTSSINETYCNKYGYKYVKYNKNFDNNRDYTWNKIYVLLDLMQKYPKTPYFLWIDSDAYINRFDKKIEDIIDIKDADIHMCSDHPYGTHAVNGGVILIKNNKYVKEILNDVWNYDENLWRIPYHEQTAISQLYEKNHKKLKKRLKVYPSELFNCRDPASNSFIVHMMQRDTDYRIKIANEKISSEIL